MHENHAFVSTALAFFTIFAHMRNKLHIKLFLLFVSMVLVAMPAIPHHHHGTGVVCMKDDLKETDCCDAHHSHHHQEDDPCCTEGCVTHFKASTPTVDLDHVQPLYVYVDTLFTLPLLRFLTQLTEKDAPPLRAVYVESLHGTYIARAAGLRAPPYLG